MTTPNPSALTLVVLTPLLAWRVLNTETPEPGINFARSPMTLAILGLLAGYYPTYAIGLMRWRLRLIRAKQLRGAKALEGMEGVSEKP